MKFRRHGTEWQLIDETAPPNACVIAILRNELEAAALKKFCELYLEAAGEGLSFPFSVDHCGHTYTVFLESGNGEKLKLRIVGPEGVEAFVQTEFLL
jgi:hypothetical protein